MVTPVAHLPAAIFKTASLKGMDKPVFTLAGQGQQQGKGQDFSRPQFGRWSGPTANGEFQQTALLPASGGNAQVETVSSVSRLDLHKESRRRRTVSVYGSSRTKPGDGYYEHARRVGEALAAAGLNVVTGGGPGSMRALATGAFRFPVNVMGMAMTFIGEEHSHDVHTEMRHFNNFFDRLDNFESEAALTAAVPGGIGSLMELTNIATKLDTGNCPYSMQKQIVLFDKGGMFRDFKKHLADNFVQRGFMSKNVLDMIHVVDEDEIEKGVVLLKKNRQFTLPAYA